MTSSNQNSFAGLYPEHLVSEADNAHAQMITYLALRSTKPT